MLYIPVCVEEDLERVNGLRDGAVTSTFLEASDWSPTVVSSKVDWRSSGSEIYHLPSTFLGCSSHPFTCHGMHPGIRKMQGWYNISTLLNTARRGRAWKLKNVSHFVFRVPEARNSLARFQKFWYLTVLQNF